MANMKNPPYDPDSDLEFHALQIAFENAPKPPDSPLSRARWRRKAQQIARKFDFELVHQVHSIMKLTNHWEKDSEGKIHLRQQTVDELREFALNRMYETIDRHLEDGQVHHSCCGTFDVIVNPFTDSIDSQGEIEIGLLSLLFVPERGER